MTEDEQYDATDDRLKFPTARLHGFHERLEHLIARYRDLMGCGEYRAWLQADESRREVARQLGRRLAKDLAWTMKLWEEANVYGGDCVSFAPHVEAQVSAREALTAAAEIQVRDDLARFVPRDTTAQERLRALLARLQAVNEQRERLWYCAAFNKRLLHDSRLDWADQSLQCRAKWARGGMERALELLDYGSRLDAETAARLKEWEDDVARIERTLARWLAQFSREPASSVARKLAAAASI